MISTNSATPDAITYAWVALSCKAPTKISPSFFLDRIRHDEKKYIENSQPIVANKIIKVFIILPPLQIAG